MSVEHMLPDTSIARMIVAWFAGTLSTTTGRPSAITRAARPDANSANGRWRRSREAPGIAARISDRLEYRAAAGRRRRWLQR